MFFPCKDLLYIEEELRGSESRGHGPFYCYLKTSQQADSLTGDDDVLHMWVTSRLQDSLWLMRLTAGRGAGL